MRLLLLSALVYSVMARGEHRVHHSPPVQHYRNEADHSEAQRTHNEPKHRLKKRKGGHGDHHQGHHGRHGRESLSEACKKSVERLGLKELGGLEDYRMTLALKRNQERVEGRCIQAFMKYRPAQWTCAEDITTACGFPTDKSDRHHSEPRDIRYMRCIHDNLHEFAPTCLESIQLAWDQERQREGLGPESAVPMDSDVMMLTVPRGESRWGTTMHVIVTVLTWAMICSCFMLCCVTARKRRRKRRLQQEQQMIQAALQASESEPVAAASAPPMPAPAHIAVPVAQSAAAAPAPSHLPAPAYRPRTPYEQAATPLMQATPLYPSIGPNGYAPLTAGERVN